MCEKFEAAVKCVPGLRANVSADVQVGKCTRRVRGKCHEIMSRGLEKSRQEIFSASVNFDNDLACVDCTSYAVISAKKAASRGKLVTSPEKRDKKRSRK